MKTVLLTTLDKPFDQKLAAIFVREGYSVFAMGKKAQSKVNLLPVEPGKAAAFLKDRVRKLDYFLDTTDYRDPKDCFTMEEVDPKIIEKVYRNNTLRSMALLEAFIDLLEAGDGRRLFWLSSAEASINETRGTSNIGYNMSKAALHQFIMITKNVLFNKRYTFRVFDPLNGLMSPEDAAESAYNYITRRRGTENHEKTRDDEDNMVMRDALGRQHSW
ncbi:MAG: hypothetical protein FWH12_07855 [Treponema sp.]|nr:hypothetical protein [Treponema sp.]